MEPEAEGFAVQLQGFAQVLIHSLAVLIELAELRLASCHALTKLMGLDWQNLGAGIVQLRPTPVPAGSSSGMSSSVSGISGGNDGMR
jgi:hypothetical protein